MDRNLSLVNEKELTALGKALSSETRIRILHLLGREPLCVNEIAELLEIPSSSAALNIRVLEEAGLIRTELRPAARGSMKGRQRKRKKRSYPCLWETMWTIKSPLPAEW